MTLSRKPISWQARLCDKLRSHHASIVMLFSLLLRRGMQKNDDGKTALDFYIHRHHHLA